MAKLVLLTDSFPFSYSEPFIENEYPYITQNFEQIFIITPLNKNKNSIFQLSENTIASSIVLNINLFEKISFLKFYFSKIIVNEKRFLKQHNIRPSWQRTKILFIEYGKAFKLYKHLLKITQPISNKNTIYVYSYWNDYKAIAASLLKKKFPQIKAISRAHRWDVYFEKNPHNYLPLKKFMLDYLDAIYLVSEDGLSYLQAKFNNHPHLKLSYLGTNNSEPFKKINKPTVFHIASCSRLVPFKRVELIIDTLALLNENCKIKWTHFGDGIEYQKILQYANTKLCNKENITFELPGFIINSLIKEVYKKGDVNLFINTSSSEGLPLSIMEAMSYGIPVIGTNVGGVSEIIQNKKNGILLKSNTSPKEIATAIEFFYNMPEDDYSTFCLNAYEIWFSKYNADINYPQFIEDVLSL